MPAPHCKMCLCEAVAVTLQMLLKNFSPGGAGGCLGITNSGGSGVRDWGTAMLNCISHALLVARCSVSVRISVSVVNMQSFRGSGLGFFIYNQPVVEMDPCPTPPSAQGQSSLS